MNQTLNRLLATMDDVMDGYREMRAVLADERSAAALSKNHRLEEVGERKQSLIHALQESEQRRQAAAGRLAAELGISDGPITAATIGARLPQPAAQQLATRAEAMRAQIKTVQRENRVNARLIAHYLELVHGSLRLINDLAESQTVYHKPGSEQRHRRYGAGSGRVFCGSV